jgi:hypothetical protein
MSGLTVKPIAVCQVGEVAVALGEACKERRIERQLRRRIDRVHAVLLVNGLPKHQPQRPSRFSKKS